MAVHNSSKIFRIGNRNFDIFNVVQLDRFNGGANLKAQSAAAPCLDYMSRDTTVKLEYAVGTVLWIEWTGDGLEPELEV